MSLQPRSENRANPAGSLDQGGKELSSGRLNQSARQKTVREGEVDRRTDSIQGPAGGRNLQFEERAAPSIFEENPSRLPAVAFPTDPAETLRDPPVFCAACPAELAGDPDVGD